MAEIKPAEIVVHEIPIQHLTVAKEMAIAVLNENMSVAYTLADKLCEMANESQESRAIAQARTRDSPGAYDGYTVYSWPEFQAFAKRLGFMWDLRTVSVTIRIAEGEMVTIDHQYAGSDIPPSGPIDTTNLHNQEWRTHEPPANPEGRHPLEPHDPPSES